MEPTPTINDRRGDIRHAIMFVSDEDRRELTEPWKEALNDVDVFNRLYFFCEHLGYVQCRTFLLALLNTWDALPADAKREQLLRAAGYIDPPTRAYPPEW